jgi:3-hydroxyisobutyrate dehydrogenase
MHAGFIGFGHLGKTIAGRLLECGHTLDAWNRTREKIAPMAVEVVSSPAATGEKADVIFLCLFDSRAVREVLNAEDGLLSGGLSGKIIIDLTTNHFREVLEFHDHVRRAGAVYLEAPVLGSVVPASQGALTVLVSGDQNSFEKVKPLLENIGSNLFFLGEAGLASRMKLINNLTLGSFMATLAEAVAFGEEAGIGKASVLEILAVGGGNSMVLNAKKAKLLGEDFSTHFSSALIYKDLHCLQDLAFELKKPLFTGTLIKELFARTYEEGIEKEDFSAVYKLFKKT